MNFLLDFPDKKHSGSGIYDLLVVEDKMSWGKVDKFIENHQGRFIFCLLSYDLKSILHDLPAKNEKQSGFPYALFVVPEQLSHVSNFGDKDIQNQSRSVEFPSEKNYFDVLNKIKAHLKRGDIYETNFCISPSLNEKINPEGTFKNIQKNNAAPYSVFLEFQNQFLLCSSPERYLVKKGNKLISQPIKGTIKRGISKSKDEQLKEQLLSDPKETAENIMIVDLVRNDLSRIANRNSVQVEKLNEVQSFKTVHQLVSTISCELKNDIQFSAIIEATFPMGSMTGAPKIRAMELMEEYEDFSRGIYSGSVGYIDEKGDFDLNVVIRSVVYDADKELVTMPVGSAITYKSDPKKEYEECRLKAESMMKSIDYGI